MTFPPSNGGTFHLHTLCVSISTHSTNYFYCLTRDLVQATVENLPHRDYFQSNLPSTNNLTCTLAGQCQTVMPTLLKITHGRWILTAAWARQVLGGKTWELDQPVRQTHVWTPRQLGTGHSIPLSLKKIRQVNWSKKVILFWQSLLQC